MGLKKWVAVGTVGVGAWAYAGTAVTAAKPAEPATCRPAQCEAMAAGMAESLYGWTGQQTACLDHLWMQESGFSPHADTRVTHAGGDGPGSAVFAYGIAQARPASKYPVSGQPASMGGSSAPAAQIRWGLADISSVYGNPCGGWAHEEAYGWY